MQIKLAYLCDYCEKHSLFKSWLKGHEKTCLFNPAHRACKSCRWWFKNRPQYGTKFREGNKVGFLPFCSHPEEDYSIETDWGGGQEPDRDYNVPRRDCGGWTAIKTWEQNMRPRLKQENIDRHNEALAKECNLMGWVT